MPCRTKTANVKLHMPNSTMQDFWVMEFSAFHCFYNYMNVYMNSAVSDSRKNNEMNETSELLH